MRASGNCWLFSLAQWLRTYIVHEGKQFAPKMSLVNGYCCIWLSANQRNRRADWSIWWMAIYINMPSMFARTATGCSRNLTRTPKRLLRRSGPVTRCELSDWPRNFEAAFVNRRAFPGLLIFSRGWCGSYQILSGWGSCIFTGLA